MLCFAILSLWPLCRSACRPRRSHLRKLQLSVEEVGLMEVEAVSEGAASMEVEADSTGAEVDSTRGLADFTERASVASTVPSACLHLWLPTPRSALLPSSLPWWVLTL